MVLHFVDVDVIERKCQRDLSAVILTVYGDKQFGLLRAHIVLRVPVYIFNQLCSRNVKQVFLFVQFKPLLVISPCCAEVDYCADTHTQCRDDVQKRHICDLPIFKVLN